MTRYERCRLPGRDSTDTVNGPLRLAYMPAEQEPVRFGTHGPIARHYGIQGDVPDHRDDDRHVIAATGG